MPAPRLRIAIVIALSACASNQIPSEPPIGYANAIVRPSCGPADGPALELILAAVTIAANPAPPFLRVAVYDGLDRVVGRTWSFSTTSDITSSSRCDTPDDCVSAQSGTVSFGRFAADSSLDAALDLRFPDGAHVQGTVRAVWRSRQFLCG